MKIIDFGISKFNALTGDMSMTTTGAVMGTPFYMSPEQAKGAAGVDARTDLYAIGVIMYEALTGRVPFEGTSFNDLMFKIVLSDAPPLPDSIPPDFRAIVQKAMSRDATNRFQTADEFILAIDRWLADNGFAGRDSSASFDVGQMASSMGPGGDLGRTAYAPATMNSGTTKTAGAWAQTNGDARPPSGPNVKVLAAIGGALLVAAGAAFALLRGGEPPKAEEKTPPLAAAPVLVEKAPTPQPEAVPAPPIAPVAAPAEPAPAEPIAPEPVVEPAPATTTAVTHKATATVTTKKATSSTTKKTASSKKAGRLRAPPRRSPAVATSATDAALTDPQPRCRP